MDLRVKDKTALIFGAGGGLGGAIARALGAEGARVYCADINGETAEATARAIGDSGGEASSIEWDLAKIDEIPRHLDTIRSGGSEVDILVNNTGGPPPTPVHGQSADAWRDHFQSMVLSVIAVTDHVLPAMKERQWGRIITSTSSGVVAPIPNLGLSNALRLSLVGWSKTLAREVGSHGVTCNIVLPGRIATDRIKFLDEKKAEREGRPVEEIRRESTATIPLGRYGEPSEYGDMVAFLASERSSYLTGSVFRVDGGLIASI